MKNRHADSNSLPLNAQVQLGDCIPIMQSMPDNSVDMILTDPPYLVNYRDRENRSIANDADDRWLKPAFEEMYRVLKDDSVCVSFYGWHQVDKFMAAWRWAGFYPAAHLVWPKPYVSRKRLVGYQHESAYLLVKGRPKLPSEPISDVLHWEYSGNYYHPTQKPVSGLQPLIESFTSSGDTIFDPFAGSGSTGLAALMAGRNFQGCELDPQYVEVAESRIEAFRVAHRVTA